MQNEKCNIRKIVIKGGGNLEWSWKISCLSEIEVLLQMEQEFGHEGVKVEKNELDKDFFWMDYCEEGDYCNRRRETVPIGIILNMTSANLSWVKQKAFFFYSEEKQG